MRQLSLFQIVVLGVFVAFTLIGVGIFASSGGISRGTSAGHVTIWGTLDSSLVQKVLDELRPNDKTFDDITYVQKNPDTYESSLLNAMASGNGPDLVLLPLEDTITFSDKILTIPYSAISQSTFTSSYIDEAQLYLTPDGTLAIPFTVDPLVMYWNKDLFATAGIANPPTHWDDLLALAPKITSLDNGSTVKKSAVALGQWSNIGNAKEILAGLFIQAGDPITAREQNGALTSVFGQNGIAESALRFYTEFANPTKTTYSWNRSLPQAQSMFVSGDLALYFGFASELYTIASRNPNLHYAVAPMPQISNGGVVSTYGSMVGLAIPRTSANIRGALAVALGLSGQTAATILAQSTNLPSVRRDITLDTSGSAAAEVFVRSALIAHGWLDPSPKDTDVLFKNMIESVLNGKDGPAAAVAAAALEFNQLISQ